MKNYLTSFILLFVVAFSIVIINGCKSAEERQQELINELPTTKKGDIYFIKEDGKYTLYKVASVSDNEIIFKGNKELVDKEEQVYKLGFADENFYMDEEIPLAKDKVKAMISSGEIFNKSETAGEIK